MSVKRFVINLNSSMDRLMFLKQNGISPGGMATANAVPQRRELENTCKSGKGIRPTKEGGMFAEEARRGTTLPGFA